jgi:hypothetical protein
MNPTPSSTPVDVARNELAHIPKVNEDVSNQISRLREGIKATELNPEDMVTSGLNKGNIKGRIEQANTQSKIKNTNQHGPLLDNMLAPFVGKPEYKTFKGKDAFGRDEVYLENTNKRLQNKEAPFYYTGKPNSYLPGRKDSGVLTEGSKVWMSRHPYVAAGYGNHVFQFANTSKLRAGASPTDHPHLATDTTGLSVDKIKELAKTNNVLKNIPDYERVFTYNKNTFKDHLLGVYEKGSPSYIQHGTEVGEIPNLYLVKDKDQVNYLKKKMFPPKLPGQ